MLNKALILIAFAVLQAQAEVCSDKTLEFSADYLKKPRPAGKTYVWGGNASAGGYQTYDTDFINTAKRAKANGHYVFAYLEGPCGDTGGVDDGEKARCRSIHRQFNKRHGAKVPDTDLRRWEPYTFHQMKEAASFGVSYCEIDNLDNNVTVPLIPILQKIKALYEGGEITCKLVLKNIGSSDLAKIKRAFPTPADAKFIAAFAIYEADDGSLAKKLTQGMVNLKGTGAVTVISTDTNHYGSRLINTKFHSCE